MTTPLNRWPRRPRRRRSRPRRKPKRAAAAPPRARRGTRGAADAERPRAARARPDAGADGQSRSAPSRRPAEDANEGKYVYCIIKTETPLSFGPLGIGADPAETHTVNYRDIAAVVSNTPMVVQDPTRDNVLAHQRVNETVMQQHTVIPMSFGTVFKTDDDIMELLRSAYDAFTDVLNKMQDKFEFGLKVLWDRDQIIREIEEEDEDIRRLKGEISSQKGSTYFARMQYGRLIDAALQARSERYVAEIFQALRDVSVASRSNKPIGDRMIMNAAFLVGRETRAGLRRAREGHRPALRQADVQVHRPVAAVQLREHPAEARSARTDGSLPPHDVHPRHHPDRRAAVRVRQDRRGRRHRAERRYARCASSCWRRRCASSSER